MSDLPLAGLPTIQGTHNVLVTGVGGTGVVTIGAVMAQAAGIDGKGVGMIEMAGLAQKGGAVWIHLRLAERPEDISAIRVGLGEAHAVIGGDLVVTGGAKTLGLMRTGVTGAAVNAHEIITGEFTRNTEFRIPGNDLQIALQARLQDRLTLFDATELARITVGDSIYSNMMVFGAAWQMGMIPLVAWRDIASHHPERGGCRAQCAGLRDGALGGVEPRSRGAPESRRRWWKKPQSLYGKDRLSRRAP